MNNKQIDKALETLTKYQNWRREDGATFFSKPPEDRLKMPSPKDIGEALDVAIYIMEGLIVTRNN